MRASSWRRGVGVAALLLAAALSLAGPGTAPASDVVVAGSIRAEVGTGAWSLRFEDRRGATVLAEAGSRGPDAPGRLGFRDATGWHHATRVIAIERRRSRIVATLATDDPQHRRLAVKVARAGPGELSLRTAVRGEPGVSSTGIGFRARPGEGYYGFGERSNAVDQRGNTIENHVSDGPFPAEDRAIAAVTTPPWGIRDRDDATYFPIPWVLSSAGYGVLIDRDETSRFDLASRDHGRWTLEVDAPTLELRVFAGPEPADALRRFSAAVGRQRAPAAPWSYGPWFQTGQPNVVPLEEEHAIIETLRSADAPVSAAETQMHFLPCGAHVGLDRYIARRTRQFHRAGLAHLGYFNPHLCTSYEPVYDRAVRAGVLQTDAAGEPFTYPAFVGGDGPAGFTRQPLAMFDFTDPRTGSFYARLLADAYAAGYDGWMEDFGEYSPPVAVSADGTPPERMHNRYPTTYHCAIEKLAARLGDRPLSRHQRSGWTGSAACADIVWGGDPTTRWGFDGLSSAVEQGVGIGMSGVARWGSDIGGYFSFGAGTERPTEEERLTPELLKRWIELGAVSPVMRTKRSGIAIPSYERPQVFDPGILPTWRRYTKLHTQLYPYLRAADAAYRRTGMPIMRHGVLTDPEDAAVVAADGQYGFGPDLLTAPVTAPGQRRQSFRLPRGRWLDFWNDVRYLRRSGAYRPAGADPIRGGREVEVDAPVGRLPMMIRAGAMLPLLPAGVDTLAGYGHEPGLVHLADRSDRLVLLAFPRGRSHAGFYDSGRLRSRELRGGGWQLAIRSRRERRWAIRASLGALRRPFIPRSVTVDGERLSRRDWSYGRDRAVLRIDARLARGVITVRP